MAHAMLTHLVWVSEGRLAASRLWSLDTGLATEHYPAFHLKRACWTEVANADLDHINADPRQPLWRGESPVSPSRSTNHWRDAKVMKIIKGSQRQVDRRHQAILGQRSYNVCPVVTHSIQSMGGITVRTFWSRHFYGTNNLSLVRLARFWHLQICSVPGLEDGCISRLEQPDFRAGLAGTTDARDLSSPDRESGCGALFGYVILIIVSIRRSLLTQRMTQTDCITRGRSLANGVSVRTTNKAAA